MRGDGLLSPVDLNHHSQCPKWRGACDLGEKRNLDLEETRRVYHKLHGETGLLVRHNQLGKRNKLERVGKKRAF